MTLKQATEFQKMDGSKLRIGIVTSLFNLELTSKLKEGAIQALLESGVSPENIYVIDVPGAVELPLGCQHLFNDLQVDGVVALGAVIRGDTDHYDYVCNMASTGCLQVSLKVSKPVGFGLLTLNNFDQGLQRVGGKHGHKGRETAMATLQTVLALKKVQKDLRSMGAEFHGGASQ